MGAKRWNDFEARLFKKYFVALGMKPIGPVPIRLETVSRSGPFFPPRPLPGRFATDLNDPVGDFLPPPLLGKGHQCESQIICRRPGNVETRCLSLRSHVYCFVSVGPSDHGASSAAKKCHCRSNWLRHYEKNRCGPSNSRIESAPRDTDLSGGQRCGTRKRGGASRFYTDCP